MSSDNPVRSALTTHTELDNVSLTIEQAR